MVPKIGTSTNPMRDPASEVKKVAEMGMDFAEVTLEPPASEPEQIMRKWEEIMGIAQEYGIYLTAHAPWWLELGSPMDEINEEGVEQAKVLIDCCGLFGMKSLNFHINAHGVSLKDKKEHFTAIFLRGGTGVIFGNQLSGGYRALALATNFRSTKAYAPWGKCDGSSKWDGNREPNGYPALDQIGRSTDAGPGTPHNLVQHSRARRLERNGHEFRGPFLRQVV